MIEQILDRHNPEDAWNDVQARKGAPGEATFQISYSPAGRRMKSPRSKVLSQDKSIFSINGGEMEERQHLAGI